jgi:hypothetical protein
MRRLWDVGADGGVHGVVMGECGSLTALWGSHVLLRGVGASPADGCHMRSRSNALTSLIGGMVQ